ncbi:MAG: DUF3995 domain-containing protein [Devosia sp.]
MNATIAVLTFLPLFTLAFAHFLWALGYTWPIRSEELLVATVIGRPGATRLPTRWLILLRAALLLGASVVAVALGDPVAGGASLDGMGLALCAFFLARGILGYTSWWRARHPVEPFATLDRRNYSPICLWIAAGFAILIGMRFL